MDIESAKEAAANPSTHASVLASLIQFDEDGLLADSNDETLLLGVVSNPNTDTETLARIVTAVTEESMSRQNLAEWQEVLEEALVNNLNTSGAAIMKLLHSWHHLRGFDRHFPEWIDEIALTDERMDAFLDSESGCIGNVGIIYKYLLMNHSYAVKYCDQIVDRFLSRISNLFDVPDSLRLWLENANDEILFEMDGSNLIYENFIEPYESTLGDIRLPAETVQRIVFFGQELDQKIEKYRTQLGLLDDIEERLGTGSSDEDVTVTLESLIRRVQLSEMEIPNFDQEHEIFLVDAQLALQELRANFTSVEYGLAMHPNTNLESLQRLAVNKDEIVRAAVLNNPNATDEIKALAISRR